MPPYVSPNSRTNQAASFAIPLAGEARPRARRTGRSRPPGAEMAAPRLRRPLPALKMAAALPRKRRPGEGEGGRASHSPRRPCGEPGRARRRGGAGSRRHRSPHGASAAGSRRCLSGLGGPCGGGAARPAAARPGPGAPCSARTPRRPRRGRRAKAGRSRRRRGRAAGAAPRAGSTGGRAGPGAAGPPLPAELGAGPVSSAGAARAGRAVGCRSGCFLRCLSAVAVEQAAALRPSVCFCVSARPRGQAAGTRPSVIIFGGF